MMDVAYEFKLPDVGEGLHEGEIVKLHVREGEPIEAYAPFLEVQTDKAIVEIRSPVTGRVRSLSVKEGQTVPVHSVIALIDVEGTEESSAADGREQPEEQPEEQKEKREEKRKEDPQEEQRSASVVRREQKEDPKERSRSKESSSSVASTKQGEGTRVFAMPAVRRLARELDVDLTKIQGSGKHGRILAEDVEKAIQSATSDDQPAAQEKEQAPERKTNTGQRTLPLRGVRKVIARRMKESKQEIPHVTIMDEWDAEELVALRRAMQALTEVKVTYLPFFVKAAVSALRAFPYFNASLDLAKEEILLHEGTHVGIAVAAEAGLVVPVIHDADQKTLVELAEEILAKAGKARAGELKPADMSGGTFTITSLGNRGGQFFTPIIAYPEAAILGIGGMQEKPVARQGEVVIRHQVPISLSFDHRLVDGDRAAQFLSHMRERMEQPKRLMMEMR